MEEVRNETNPNRTSVGKLQGLKKAISFRLFFTVVWRSVCQVLRFIGKLFGYKDESTYIKVVWRMCVSCFAILVFIFTSVVIYEYVNEVVIAKWIRPNFSERVYSSEPLSGRIFFQYMYWSDKTRIYDNVAKKVLLEDVKWVVVSEDHDSLAVFAQGDKRGYINRFTGEIRVPATYSRAWVFSEGLAAVEKDGKLLFIDHSGNVVIDRNIEVYHEETDYVFHNGYCLLKNPVDGNEGLINKKGDWVLLPEYECICRRDDLWIVQKGGGAAVLDNDMNIVLPYSRDKYYFMDGGITSVRENHTLCKYNQNGELIEDFCINYIEPMTYKTDELRYNMMRNYDDNGNLTCETTDDEPDFVEAMAKCRRYQAEYGWYGLITADGTVVTLPSYTYISAVGYDLYLCKDDEGNGIIINGKGEQVKSSVDTLE